MREANILLRCKEDPREAAEVVLKVRIMDLILSISDIRVHLCEKKSAEHVDHEARESPRRRQAGELKKLVK